MKPLALCSVGPAIVFVLLVGLAPRAAAFERGDQCTLKSPLPVTIKTKRGSVEATMEKGTDITVTFAGEGGITRVQAGETNGTVVTVDLEAACAGTLRLCTLKAPVTMFEKNRSDSRSFKIKAGADVSLLKRGKTWAAIRVGDLMGFVDTAEISTSCRSQGSDEVTVDTSVDGGVEEVERNEGPGVLLLPFSLEGNAPAGVADGYFQTMWERTTYFRPDAGKVDDEGGRKLSWKKYVERSAARAAGADMRYVIVGRLFIDDAPAPAGEVKPETYVLNLGVVEAKSGKLLKGVRVKPSTRLDDPWADNVLAKLLPEVAAAPGSRTPEARGGNLELAPNPGSSSDPGAVAAAPPPAATWGETPWFANPLGFAALGVGVLAGGGGAVLAWLALADNTAANATPITQSTRAERRDSALVKGVAADALGVVAVAAVVTSVVVFVTRAGIE